MDNVITAGKVLNSFGLNGQVKIDVYLEDLKLLKTVKVFLLGDSLLKRKINFLINTKNSTWIADVADVKIKEQADQKGFVHDVFNFGSGEVLEVSLDDSDATRYIPFDKDNVSEIDLANRTIILTPIKGLLS